MGGGGFVERKKESTIEAEVGEEVETLFEGSHQKRGIVWGDDRAGVAIECEDPGLGVEGVCAGKGGLEDSQMAAVETVEKAGGENDGIGSGRRGSRRKDLHNEGVGGGSESVVGRVGRRDFEVLSDGGGDFGEDWGGGDAAVVAFSGFCWVIEENEHRKDWFFGGNEADERSPMVVGVVAAVGVGDLCGSGFSGGGISGDAGAAGGAIWGENQGEHFAHIGGDLFGNWLIQDSGAI